MLRRMRAIPSLALALSLGLSSCHIDRIESADIPLVRIQTTGGFEQGVSTDFGVLFLGRTAQKGPAKLLYWLGPSPLIEAGEIEVVGGPVHRIRTDVPIPSVPISFEPVAPEEQLVLMGMEGQLPWRLDVQLAKDEIVRGTALHYPAGLQLRPDSVGLGIFRETEAGLALVGLVKAAAELDNGKRFLLFAGLSEMREAFAKARRAMPVREVEYRADGKRILRYRR
ncbi:MAG: hypothetical protein CSA62_06610 [Planctomycetota bacterium]|nr:MAG: hypothetical protein CSA62_06610 [Planctomycetota bacterium]